jgi:hypothetical protein
VVLIISPHGFKFALVQQRFEMEHGLLGPLASRLSTGPLAGPGTARAAHGGWYPRATSCHGSMRPRNHNGHLPRISTLL